jgi:hypothetical protein
MPYKLEPLQGPVVTLFTTMLHIKKYIPLTNVDFVFIVDIGPWMWVPVTTAWRVLRLQIEERRPIWRVAVNKLNKQPRTAD